jgi:transcriptional regulator with XRE-family HTH domain
MGIAKSGSAHDALPELTKWMADTGTTQEDLASFAKVSQAQISRYLAGKVDLPVERAMKLALITNIPVEKLLNDRDASRLLKLLGKRSNAEGDSKEESDEVA